MARSIAILCPRLSISTGYSAILAFFATTSGVAPTVVQQHGTVNLFTSGTIVLSSSTIAGNNILVALQNSDTTQASPASGAALSDTQGNQYVLIGSLANGGGNTQAWLYGAFNIPGGACTITFNCGVRIRGAITAMEISGMGGGQGTPTFRSLVPADIPNLDASKITTGLLALAHGGTHADLSATGGAHQVLQQTSVDANITVGQLAFSDISGTTGQTQIPVGGVNSQTTNYTAVSGDSGKLISFNSATPVTLTLPASPPSANWNIEFENVGTGMLTVNRNGLNIDGAANNLTVSQNQGGCIYTDGTNYFTQRGFSYTPFNQSMSVDSVVMSDDYWISVDSGAYDQALPLTVV
jgi:hypothetical protein